MADSSDKTTGKRDGKRRSTPGNYTPVLGLFSGDEPRPLPTLPEAKVSPATIEATGTLELSVIIPARNEERNLGACLETLVAQSERVFALGTDWELVIVDDASGDGTRALAQSYADRHPGVRVLPAPAFAMAADGREFTGKTNACWAGAQASGGRWLLFTDADTLHEPGDLRRGLHEATRHEVALLSYSPRQILHGLAQHLVMPLIFSELASVYPPAKVNDPDDRTAAANGQYLLIDRATYFAVGGHKAVGPSILEDVELAYKVKRAKKSIRLRYAPDALSTRMYRDFRDMVEGWTKNLSLLFPHTMRLVLWRLLDLLLLLLPVLLWLFPYLLTWQRVALLALWARTLLRFYQRVGRAHSSFLDSAMAPLGLPLFLGLLLRSLVQHRLLHRVQWKGRQYRT